MDEISRDGLTLTKYGMLFIEDYETAVIADLHIGYEDVMSSKGIFLPRIQKRFLIERLEVIIDKYQPRQLIINGDFKHEFSRNMRQEWDEIEEVLDFLSTRVDVVVVRGNHDNFLKTILGRRGLTLYDKYTIGRYTMVHGHREHEVRPITIIGHEHPSISLRDELSATVKVPCFLYSPDLIVLPAMSIYASGTDITKNEFISPILQKNKRDFEIYGIDEHMGVLPMGRLSSLPAPSEDYPPLR
ncbi:MAG: metallophosphoesterase [Euryarchaeota archaeon]|nr:metallophosphoesterase [Euryarchaeota archaeon]